MNRNARILSRIRLIFGISSLALSVTVVAASTKTMTRVDYRDKDPGSDPYPTRLLVTPNFMRIDYGNDTDDFILLDRKSGKVFNVMRDRKEILELAPGKVDLKKPLVWQVREDVRKQSGGLNAARIYVNDVLCSEVEAAPGVLPDVVKALGEYRSALEATQARTYSATPSELQAECELAQNVFETQRELRFGLPVKELYKNGRSRELVNHRSVSLAPQLFALPTGYRTWSLTQP